MFDPGERKIKGEVSIEPGCISMIWLFALIWCIEKGVDRIVAAIHEMHK